MKFTQIILVAFLVAATEAGPTGTRNSECAPSCEGNSKFLYEIGRKYVYRYEAETTFRVQWSEDFAPVKVSADATIQPVTSCEYVLSLSDIVLHGTEKSEEFAGQLTRKPLRFAITNGQIEHICGTEDEPQWVINFKRAVLSNFQNSMTNIEENEVLTETDVSGICETSYSSTTDGDEILITRTKSPSECANKPQIQQKLSSFGYSFDSLVQGIQLLKSSQECKQVVAKELIKSVECEESHLFQPFSKYDSGSETRTKTSLTLVDVTVASPLFLESYSTRNELSFDYPEPKSETSALEEAESVLSKLEAMTKDGIKREVPRLFSELVMSLKGLTHSQIHKLYEKCGDQVKSFIADALPLVGTSESMKEFVELINEGKVSEAEQDVWFTSLAFIKNPTLDMFSAMQELFENKIKNTALLGVSSMVHNYCSKDTECDTRPSISKLIRVIESRLGLGCRATTEEEKENILYSLKAIGNTGRFINIENVLQRCYLEDNAMEIRLAAIDAWRRTPCSYDREHLLSTYIDQYQDSEIRIAAYLALMKCPTQELVDTIKDRLTSESVNQVESFVWSHLANLQETASQEKQWIRELIGDDLLQKKFSKETLKLSRNFESSFYLTEQKFGASADSNVIFSEKSFFPRSSMLNLTIDLFGDSINLFEVGGRVEGIETLVEKFFGPEGYYPEETMAAIVKNLRRDNQKDETNLEGFLAKDEDDVKGSFYFKMFGNELFYKNFQGIQNAFPDMTISNIIDIVMELVTKGNIDYTKNYELIKSEFMYPTITGFPIKLKLDGSATVGLKMDGHFNFESLSSIDVKGKLQPSAAVRMDAAMTVDAVAFQSGFKVVSTVHSSTTLEGKALVKDGKLADFILNVPEDNMEIFDMEWETLKIDSQGENKIDNPTHDFERCFPIISNTFGMTLCYKKQNPALSDFPLPGPFKIEYFLKKTDSHSSYVFQYSRTPEKTILLLDMPGSRSDKKWSSSLTRGNEAYDFEAHTPFKSVKGSVSYVFERDEIGIEAKITTDDDMEFETKFKLGTVNNFNQRKVNVELLFDSNMFRNEVIRFSVSGIYEKDTKSVDTTVKLSGEQVPALECNFKLNRRAGEKSLTFDLATRPIDLNLSGSLNDLSSRGGLISLKGQYRLMSSDPRRLTTTVEYKNLETTEGNSFTASINAKELDFKMDFVYDTSDTTFSTKTEGKFQQIPWLVQYDYEHTVKDGIRTLKSAEKVEIPSVHISFDSTKRLMYSREKMESDFHVKSGLIDETMKMVLNFGKEYLFNLKHHNSMNAATKSYNLEVRKQSENSYDLLATVERETDNRKLSGHFRYDTSNDAFYATTQVSYESQKSYKFNWDIHYKTGKFSSETSLDCEGKLCYVNLIASPTSLSIDANYPRAFTATAKIEEKEEEKEFLITSKLDNEVFEAAGKLSPKSLEGELKFRDREMKLMAQLEDQSFELEAQLSPSKRIDFEINYTTGSEMSFYVGLKTPFQNWEKQDARFVLSLGDSVQGQASITWANTHHMTVMFDGSMDSSEAVTNFEGKARFTSTFIDFEKIELSIKHAHSRREIHTKFEAGWNTAILNAYFDAAPTENGFNVNLKAITPFTDELSIAFVHEISREGLSTSLIFAYGVQESKIMLQGNIIDCSNINGSFISSGPMLPEIFAKLNLESREESNSKHVSNLRLSFKKSSTTFIKINFSKDFSKKGEFESTLEVMSDFIPDKEIKAHIEGILESINSLTMKGFISGKNINVKINMNHKVLNNNLQTELNFYYNSSKTSITLGGNMNPKTMEGNLRGEIKSTENIIDGYRMIIEHTVKGETRETYITLIKKEFNVKVHHSIAFKNYLNWSSSLNVNDAYSMRSEMMSSEGALKHNTKISWFGKKIIFSFNYKNDDMLELMSSLDSPWTTLYVTLTHEQEEARRKVNLKIENGKGKNILLKSEYEFTDVIKFISLSILNKEWNLKPLSMELKATKTNQDTLDITMRYNQIITTILQFFKKDETRGATLVFKHNNEFRPLAITGKFTQSPGQIETFVEYESELKHSFDLKLVGDMSTGSVYLTSVLPVFFDEPMKTSLTYNLKEFPMQLKITNLLQDKKHELNFVLDSSKLLIECYCPDREGKIKANWFVDEHNKTLVVEFKSPFESIKNTYFKAELNSEYSKRIDLEILYDVHRVELKSSFGSTLLKIDVKTTFRGMENIYVEVTFSNYEVKGIVKRNKYVGKFSGSGNFNSSKGDGKITISIPHPDEDEVFNYSSSLSYSVENNLPNVHFETNFFSKNLKFDLKSFDDNSSQRNIVLQIESPWKNMQTMKLESVIERSGFKLEGVINEIIFDSSMKFNFEESNKANFIVMLNSNVAGWKSFSIESDINLSQKPYSLSVQFEKEDQIKEYFFSYNLNEKNINVELRSPIKNMEDIKISGDYKFERQRLSLSILIENGKELFNLYGTTDFSQTIPAVELNVSTPLKGREIQFKLNGSFEDKTSMYFFLRIGPNSYKVNVSSQLQKMTGIFTLDFDLPIEHFKNFKTNFSYDLDSTTKFAVIDLEHDEKKDRFSFQGKLSANDFTFGVETPIESYRTFIISGKYTERYDEIVAQGTIINNDTELRFEGRVVAKENGYEFESKIPYYNTMIVTGKITNEKIIVKINRGLEEEELLITYSFDNKNAFIKIKSPFEYISYFAIGGKFEVTEEAIDTNLYFNKNTDSLEIEGKFKRTPGKMYLDANFKNSFMPGNYGFKIHYDIASENKEIGLLMNRGTITENYLLKALYRGSDHGYIKLYTPFQQYKTTGFEYKFRNDNMKETELFVMVFTNSDEISLGVQSVLKDNEIILKLLTPFRHYEIFGLEGRLDTERKEGEAKIFIGDYVFAFESSVRPENLLFCIETPFKGFKIFKLFSTYGWTTSKKFVITEFLFNDQKYKFDGNLTLSKMNPEIDVTFVLPLLPLHSDRIIKIYGKYNLYNPAELLDLEFLFSSIKYGLSLGAEFNYLKAMWKFDLTTPIEQFTNVKFNGNIDFYSARKLLDIEYGREDKVKKIHLSGLFTDDDIGFSLESSFEALGNVRTRGTLSRSRRSAEFEMVNDGRIKTVVASFNSLEIRATTPFEKARNLNFELKKNNRGGWTLNYKRNNNKAYVTFTAQPKKKGFSISLESELPGWEFLALAGRIDAEEILAYITGQKNSTMVHITGKGKLDPGVGSLEVTATSSLETYKKVVLTIEYNSRRNLFTFDCRSESSDFRILIELKRGLSIDIFVPNDIQNTIAKGKFGPFQGNFDLSSRFSNFRTFKINYDLKLGPVIKAEATIERNAIKLFELDFEANPSKSMTHLMIHARRGENHSMLHFHREAWKKLDFIFSRNGKEYKEELTGSGDLPLKGVIDYKITNSFREVPREVTGKITIDRTSSPKKIVLEATWYNGKFYTSTLMYNFDLAQPNEGSFTLRTTTPERYMARWKDIEGNWKFDRKREGTAYLRIGQTKYNLEGKIGILDVDLQLTSNRYGNTYVIQWKLMKSGKSRDYFIKLGTVERFVMLKLKGKLDTIFNGDITGAIRISRFMRNDFNFTAKWARTSDGLSGSGTFSFGKYKGTHTLTNFKRNPAERSSVFHWEATSNIEGFGRVILDGEYSLARKMIDVKLSWDTDEIYIKGSLDNFSTQRSENTITGRLAAFGDVRVTLSHDFTNPLKRTIKALGNIGHRTLSYVINWTRNEDLTEFDLNGDLQSPIFGTIHIHSDFDLKDLSNAKGSFQYTRNNDKSLSVNWSRVKTETNLADELILTSSFNLLPRAEVYLNADWVKGFKMTGGIKWKNKSIEASLKVGSKSATAYIKTPFELFGDVNVDVTYDIKRQKSKSVNLIYTRRDKVVKVDFSSQIQKKNVGSLTLSISTPFDIVRNLSFNANWKKGKFNAVYKRNDKTINLDGVADVKFSKSSFDLKFTPPNSSPINIALSYDLQSFIKGTEKAPKDLLNVKVDLGEHSVNFIVKGFRTPEKVNLDISGSTSFDIVHNFKILLDSELNLDNREGYFEITVDDFHIDIKNTFERRPNGFYAKSQIHSTMTKLPGLTIGVGKDGDSYILTTGFGDEREISFTINGKDGFKSGFNGTIDMPRRGIFGLEYDLSYSFKSRNELQANLSIKVAEGKKIEAEIIYNSSGLMGRLLHPILGGHSARMRRSISDNHFMADIGIDQYGFTLQGDYNNRLFQKGVKIEGEIFGEKVLIDGFVKLNDWSDTEGKLLVKTPFDKFNTYGGSFKVKASDEKFYGNIDFELPSPFSLKIDLDLMNKINGEAVLILGDSTYEVTCDFVARNDNIMEGNMIINTPHVSIKRIFVDGTINAKSFKEFQLAFNIQHPSGSFDFDLSLNAVAPTYSLICKFDTNKDKVIELKANYTVTKYPFHLKGDCSININGIKIFNSKSEVINDNEEIFTVFEGSIKECFTGSLDFRVNKEYIKTGLSAKIANNKNIETNVNISRIDGEILINSMFKGEENYIKLLHKKENMQRNSKLEINMPNLIKGSMDLVYSKLQQWILTLNLETSACVQKLNLHVASTIQTNGSTKTHFLNEMDIMLPMFDNICKTYAEFNVLAQSFDSTFKFYCGQSTNTMHFRYERVMHLYNVFLSINSPILPSENENKVMVTCDFQELIRISIESMILDTINNFNLEITRDYNLSVNTISPLIPTGMAKLEGSFIPSSLEDSEFNIRFVDGIKTLSAHGKLKWDVDNETKLFLEIRTPVEDYEKVEIGFDFVKKDMTRLAVYMSPLTLMAESYYGIEDSKFNAGMKFQTGEGKDSITQVEAIIPLNEFGPKLSATFDGQEYEIEATFDRTDSQTEVNFSSQNIMYLPQELGAILKTTVPYEFGFEYKQTDRNDLKFGIVFDSSFLNLVDGRYVLLG